MIIIIILHKKLFQVRPCLIHCWISQPLNRNAFTGANLAASFIQDPEHKECVYVFAYLCMELNFYPNSLSGFQDVTEFNFLLCKLWLWSSHLSNCTILADVTLSYKTLMCILMFLYWFFMKVWALHISSPSGHPWNN